MTTLRYITAGESHGKALIGILEGIPSGLSISAEDIDRDLKRRQGGHGRGGRMKIESDHAEILSGVCCGKTIGSPISILIENKDWANWQDVMSSDNLPESPHSPLWKRGAEGDFKGGKGGFVTRPRPGHADLSGAIKYDSHDIRNILERSSARETAMRVALGVMAKKFLSEFNIKVGSHVIQIGTVRIQNLKEKELSKIFEKAEKSPVRCPDEVASKKMVKLIDRAIKEGNSLGGIFEVFVIGVPVGLGSHIQWDRRLDGRLAQALMSIQAIKGVEVGLGFDMSRRFGSEVMDEIFYRAKSKEQRAKSINSELRTPNSELTAGFYRKTNYAGGIEGGMTNGMPIILRAAMKPIPTQKKPLRSIDIITKRPVEAAYERSDICAVPAASVIGEAMIALTIADAFLEKFGGDSITEVKRNYDSYIEYIKKF
ncbi:MAG: chorismate synthase [Nitrospirae bacterium CG_4_10_14_0_8_um_filter_41_23]|nr:chorismate synthase [Nitrospirota bacterium]OIP59960.1 MAG: chorismate synthase [Nitrospirae bacterium CG2_30_41_42]PIQ93839.1 MAG: chorismate synthase [Nitrospirae bacterium CG11_big_fil_rev_8_21_14_0_20_41_14]PIV40936.1 MAG: chorismate synthase [Nitrospirae bacterium CG02_land_8_20_14_3_00_41_53]PIW87059.1 MAG: chorismate synthase [Nitrospirae bacterium CG_4_8_14_3_um_filter_41_47]PIY86713.1 MAG: chorismate synthase [Nitrospirae bacterium CG_4_10_14_0_8_um_filter_41_23]PJA80427.1 MAG: ch